MGALKSYPDDLFNLKVARAMWAKGLDTFDIAEAFGLHESFVYRFLRAGRLYDIAQASPNGVPFQ